MINVENMKKIFVFDTETTGFVSKHATMDKQPEIIQFAGEMLCAKEGGKYEVEYMINQIFYPLYQVGKGASDVHGWTKEKLREHDAPGIEPYLQELYHRIITADLLVGHNLKYDIQMMELEFERYGLDNFPFLGKKVADTMFLSIDICKIPGPYGKAKRPKLQELHKYLFGEEFKDAHDARADITATKNCFFELCNKHPDVMGDYM